MPCNYELKECPEGQKTLISSLKKSMTPKATGHTALKIRPGISLQD